MMNKIKNIIFLLIGVIIGILFLNVKNCYNIDESESISTIESESESISGIKLFNKKIKRAGVKNNNRINFCYMVQDRDEKQASFINLLSTGYEININNGLQLRTITYYFSNLFINNIEVEFIPTILNIDFTFTDATGNYESIEQLQNQIIIIADLDYNLTTKKININFTNNLKYGNDSAIITSSVIDLGTFSNFEIDYITQQQNNIISTEQLLQGFNKYAGPNYNNGYDAALQDIQKNPNAYNLYTQLQYENYGVEQYNAGTQNSINTNWIWGILDTLTSFCNIEILPNIKLIYLAGVALVLGFVKFIIGWLK